jgi:hypothetical protein
MGLSDCARKTQRRETEAVFAVESDKTLASGISPTPEAVKWRKVPRRAEERGTDIVHLARRKSCADETDMEDDGMAPPAVKAFERK